MLIRFKIGNFLSFAEPQTLDMTAGKFRNFSERTYKDNTCKLLKFKSIYGANASGKSNLIYAFAWFQRFVVNGFKRGSYTLYCKLDESYKEQPSSFEIKIRIEEKIFVYGFNIILNSASVVKEYLYEELKNQTKKYVFNREPLQGTFTVGTFISPSSMAERIKIYAEDIKYDDSILFLKLMNQNKDSLYTKKGKLNVFKAVYNWIRYTLDVNTTDNSITNYSFFNNNDYLEMIVKKLNHFGLDIEKLNFAEISEEKFTSDFPKDILSDIKEELITQNSMHTDKSDAHNPSVMIRSNANIFVIGIDSENNFTYRTIELKHKYSSATFSLKEESDGTVRLLDIIEILLTQSKNKVYILDEVNRTFHPLLTIQFIKDFLELAKERNIQLIVTTHESQLMDLKLLRKDEIGFVNKTDNGFSEMYSLSKFDIRFDKIAVTEYFKGHFNAIPQMSNRES